MTRQLLLVSIATVIAGCGTHSSDVSSPTGGDASDLGVVVPKDKSAGATRAHLSANRQHVALFRRTGDQFEVLIDDVSYGPYLDADVATISPFLGEEDLWLFRAQRDDGYVLVTASGTFGPFNEVWPPSVEGARWGALVKQGIEYHVLVDGILSSAFDEIAGDHRLDLFDLQLRPDLQLPMFYGANQWAFLARKASDLFVVTERMTYGPFSEIRGQTFQSADDDLFAADLHRHLSFDRSTLAVGISKADAGAQSRHYVWIDGTEHGPFSVLPEFYAYRDMSLDGKHWAFTGPNEVNSDTGTVSVPLPTPTALSNNGQTLAYAFGDGDDHFIVVNDQKSGPYDGRTKPDVSQDGSRWLAGFSPLGDDRWYVATDSGQLGPYPKVSRPRFAGDQQLIAVNNSDGSEMLLIDGQSFGPFEELLYFGPDKARTESKTWFARGTTSDGMVDVFDSGQRIAQVGPFSSVNELRVKSSHWSALVGRNGKLHIVEDGELSEPVGPFEKILRYSHSPDARQIALHARDSDGKGWVVFREHVEGPYELLSPSTTISVDFSPNGKHWGFQFVNSNRKRHAVHNLGESPNCDDIVDWTVTDRGVVFAARSGDEWWIHIGSERHGPFAAAGIVVEGSRVAAAVVERDEVTIRDF